LVKTNGIISGEPLASLRHWVLRSHQLTCYSVQNISTTCI